MESPLFSVPDRENPRSCLRPVRLRLSAIYALFLGALILLPTSPLCAGLGTWGFIRADINGDGNIDLADAIGTLNWLFVDGVATPNCFDAYDINDDGAINLSDPILLLTFLFVDQSLPPPPPQGSCGTDLTADNLDCVGPVPGCPNFVPPTIDILYGGSAGESQSVFLIPQTPPADAAEFPQKELGMRPLTIGIPSVVSSGGVELSTVDPGLSLYRTDGTNVPLPAVFLISELPVSLLLNGDEAISTRLVATSLESGAQTELPITAGPFPGLAGNPLNDAPFFRFAQSIPIELDEVSVAIDPLRYRDRIGETFDLYIVGHRDGGEWVADNSLTDITGMVETLTLDGNSIVEMIIPAWTGGLNAGTLVSRDYDVVLDFGQDGFLDPGDILDGGDRGPAFSVVKQLTELGPYAVTTSDLSAGGFTTQRVYYPTDLQSLDPQPLVVISHGNGHEYTWYDYLGEHLSSHGYVVMSHMNNTMPGVDAASSTTLSNVEYFQGNVDTLLGGALAGKVRTDQMAWIGHSRGGEGVVRAYDRIDDGIYTPFNFSASDLKLISSIAPTFFLGISNSNPHGVPYHLLAGSADGDVTGGVDCPVCQFFRIVSAAEGPTQVTYIQGADHNDFNCCGFPDGVGPAQIPRPEVHEITEAYYLVLMEYYLKGNRATLEYLQRSPRDLLPAQSMAVFTLANQYRAGPQHPQFVIDDFQETPPDLSQSSSGWAVNFDVDQVQEGKLVDGNAVLSHVFSDRFNGMTWAGTSAFESAAGLVFEWANGVERFYEWSVPAGIDENWRRWNILSFRVCQGTRHPNTNLINGPLDFTVTLVDRDGVTASLSTREYAEIATPYRRGGLGFGAGWSNEFHTIRIRLADFEVADPQLDLGKIATLRFQFGNGFGTSVGKIGVDDVMLVD